MERDDSRPSVMGQSQPTRPPGIAEAAKLQKVWVALALPVFLASAEPWRAC